MAVDRIYNVIGSSFKGVMVFKYNLNGVLTAFELVDAEEFNAQQIAWFFSHHFPYYEHQIKNFKAYKEFTVTEGEFELKFEDFWSAYNYKVKRLLSEKAWNKLTNDEKLKAITSIRHYDSYLARKRTMEKAHPSTYLNQKYFNDHWGSAN